jgi:mycoredoxin
MTFTMYSTTWCGYCKRLKRQLNDLGITFEEVNIEEVPDAAALIEKINNGNQVVPTLVFSDGTSMTNPPAADVQAKLATL